MKPFNPIAAITEAQTLTIDFGPRLGAGVILTGTPTVTLTVMNGTDDTPQSRLHGDPQIGVAPLPNGTGIANASVLFQVINCVAGVTYGVSSYCADSSGDTPEIDTSFLCYAPD